MLNPMTASLYFKADGEYITWRRANKHKMSKHMRKTHTKRFTCGSNADKNRGIFFLFSHISHRP